MVVANEKKVLYVLLIAIFAIIISVVVIIFSNPLRRSNERIRADMLKLTPIGTSMKDVIQVIESNKSWEWRGQYIANIGYSTDESLNNRIGSQSIRVTLGTYSHGFIVYVLAFWGFDEDGILIDVHIRKDIAGF